MTERQCLSITFSAALGPASAGRSVRQTRTESNAQALSFRHLRCSPTSLASSLLLNEYKKLYLEF